MPLYMRFITISTRVDSFRVYMENDPPFDSSRRVDSFGPNGSTLLAESRKSTLLHINAISANIGIYIPSGSTLLAGSTLLDESI